MHVILGINEYNYVNISVILNQTTRGHVTS